jgi:Fe-S cluster assembly protein SufD
MASAVSSLKKYVEEYDEIKSTLPGQELDWLVQLRQQGLDQFSTQGFPTIRDEDWRYTNVTPFIKILSVGASKTQHNSRARADG